VSWPWPTTTLGSYQDPGLPRRHRRPTIQPHLFGILVAAAVLLAFDAARPRSAPVAAGEDDPLRSRQTVQPVPSASLADFVAEMHRILKTQRERLIQIATGVFPAPSGTSALSNQLVDQRVTTMGANAAYKDAKLSREIAEIAILEYSDGIFVQDGAVAEGELMLARSEVSRKRAAPDELINQLARIERASKGSARELAVEFGLRDSIVDAKRRERKARIEVAKAEAKLNLLNEFAKPIRLRELQAEVEATRAEELEKRAAYEFEMAKGKRSDVDVRHEKLDKRALDELKVARQKMLAARAGKDYQPADAIELMKALAREFENSVPPGKERVISVIESAIAVEQQIRAKLIEAATDEKLGSTLQEDIRGLTAQLQAIIEEAEFELSALKLDYLKPRIHREASPAESRAK